MSHRCSCAVRETLKYSYKYHLGGTLMEGSTMVVLFTGFSCSNLFYVHPVTVPAQYLCESRTAGTTLTSSCVATPVALRS